MKSVDGIVNSIVKGATPQYKIQKNLKNLEKELHNISLSITPAMQPESFKDVHNNILQISKDAKALADNISKIFKGWK